MKKRKVMLLSIFMILLLSGCTGQYEVKINKDLSLEESFTIIGDERFSLTGYTPDSMFQILTNTYQDYYDSSDQNLFSNVNNDNKLMTSFQKSYSSLDNYKNSFYIKQIYEEGFTVTEKENMITLDSSGSLQNFWVLLPGDYEEELFSEVNISIQVPYVVGSHNADIVDKDHNIYTWIYDYQESDKTIHLSFNKDKEFVSSKSQLWQNIFIIASVVIVVGLVIYFGYRYYQKKNKEVNKI